MERSLSNFIQAFLLNTAPASRVSPYTGRENLPDSCPQLPHPCCLMPSYSRSFHEAWFQSVRPFTRRAYLFGR